jgi:hypothetical protein
MLIAPVSAITYPKEYYDLGVFNDVFLIRQSEIQLGRWDITTWGPNVGAFSSLITSRELRRQTILMEKQNELLEEQNNLTRMQMGMKLKCKIVADIAAGAHCTEYAWVV